MVVGLSDGVVDVPLVVKGLKGRYHFLLAHFFLTFKGVAVVGQFEPMVIVGAIFPDADETSVLKCFEVDLARGFDLEVVILKSNLVVS